MKSSFINQIIYYWIFNAPYKVGILSLELSAGQYGTSLLSTHIKHKLTNMSADDRDGLLKREDIQEKIDELFKLPDGTDRFFLIEDRDSKLDSVKAMIERLIISSGVKIIILDPIQDLFAGLSLGEEQEFMRWQKSIIKAYKVLIINVCHTRKPSGGDKAGSTGGMIQEESIQGSSDIYKSASAIILFTRNKLAEDPIERNTTSCYVSKNRWSGHTGPAGSFIYKADENWLYDAEEYKEKFPEDFVADLEGDIEYA